MAEVTVSVGDYEHSFLHGDGIICRSHVNLTYIESLLVCNSIIRGRYLTIQDQSDYENFLDFCELEIYGTSMFYILSRDFSNCILNNALSCMDDGSKFC